MRRLTPRVELPRLESATHTAPCVTYHARQAPNHNGSLSTSPSVTRQGEENASCV